MGSLRALWFLLLRVFYRKIRPGDFFSTFLLRFIDTAVRETTPRVGKKLSLS